MLLVHLKDSIDFYSEYCVSDDINNIDHERAIDKIGHG